MLCMLKVFVITCETDLTSDDLCSTCRTEDETDLNLGTSFSAETNRRDEDADMYVMTRTQTCRHTPNWSTYLHVKHQYSYMVYLHVEGQYAWCRLVKDK